VTAAATRFDTGTSELGDLRFGYLLRAEWVKFRTVRGWVIGIVVGALLMIAFGLLTAGGGSTTCQTGPSSPVLSGAACLPRIPLGPGGEAVTDTFSFAHQALDGNGVLTVRVTSLAGRYSTGGISGGPDPAAGFSPGLQPWSKAGIIIAASNRPGAAYAAMMVTGGHGVRMQFNYTGDLAGPPGRVSAASPRWLRLVRAGDELTGYESGNGTAWTQVGAVRLAGLPAVLQAGMFATSPDHTTVVSQSLDSGTSSGGPSLATAGFDHVALSGARSGASWRHSVVGAGPGDLAAGLSGFTRASGGRFTVTGSGDIAPVVAGSSASAIGQYLTGGFIGLIAAIIVAVMFVTAEYRRGLIRVTLAATPRRGRVLAAKAIVAAAVTFAAGLVAAAVIIPVAGRLAHDKGSYVLPVTPLAAVQLIVGTAALLAVAAVLAVAIATALRRSAAAVTAGIVLIVLPYVLATTSVLPTGAEQWLLRLTPAAAVAVQSTTPQYPQVTASYTPSAGYFPLAPWAGLAVLCGYAAVALALAWWLLRRRDA
jgi:ABC-type transport system involved in multi-copper enzyme maturation permease subunit